MPVAATSRRRLALPWPLTLGALGVLAAACGAPQNGDAGGDEDGARARLLARADSLELDTSWEPVPG
ncbi:MAG TPA: hypothetical protein VLA43_13100, partial [Longimicrobiales bacterium]|nr:hypothetical protein [Longimicrobiales bacterium]